MLGVANSCQKAFKPKFLRDKDNKNNITGMVNYQFSYSLKF